MANVMSPVVASWKSSDNRQNEKQSRSEPCTTTGCFMADSVTIRYDPMDLREIREDQKDVLAWAGSQLSQA